MANEKVYLDADGVRRLKEYIDAHFNALQKAIDLLNNTDGTPGSIQQMIDDAINNLTLNNIPQTDNVIVDGGSAPSQEDEP